MEYSFKNALNTNSTCKIHMKVTGKELEYAEKKI